MSDVVSAVVYPGKLNLTAQQFEQIFGWQFSANTRVEATSPIVEWEDKKPTDKKKLFDGKPAYEARGLEAAALDPTTGEHELQVKGVKVRVRQPVSIPRWTAFVPEGNVTVTFSAFNGTLNCSVLVDNLVPVQRPQAK
ncbi:hypothetical protein [Bifidobacterium vespertilionis]|uniref:Uncharacterized protein n=1 Tax=Bifidobacterium vespertilionis TaxID=2562524 RepID=A0A5J5E3Z5_9BIFI|nr:hypothetical protein [Bifidobacterium vespertilionis]KAA8820193.1 hypothetical protein EMO90_07120 [Bifidobacterium vespertilionis]KAA8823882.1 hypothetical protein EM848_03530 [Bifidobacterium vespertilionis]